eukprot:30109-Pelagomonas_calceolata.AAC.2
MHSKMQACLDWIGFPSLFVLSHILSSGGSSGKGIHTYVLAGLQATQALLTSTPQSLSICRQAPVLQKEPFHQRARKPGHRGKQGRAPANTFKRRGERVVSHVEKTLEKEMEGEGRLGKF